MNSPGKLWRLSLDDAKMEPVDIGAVRGVNNDHGNLARRQVVSPSPPGNIFVLPSTGGQPRQVTQDIPSYFSRRSRLTANGWPTAPNAGDNFDIYRIPL